MRSPGLAESGTQPGRRRRQGDDRLVTGPEYALNGELALRAALHARAQGLEEGVGRVEEAEGLRAVVHRDDEPLAVGADDRRRALVISSRSGSTPSIGG
ncbi:MAG: hypothetical protein M3Q31_02425 [Actinomycetota bacterium]|nr:hypothetical protein [Actinomycetota bacterium]